MNRKIKLHAARLKIVSCIVLFAFDKGIKTILIKITRRREKNKYMKIN